MSGVLGAGGGDVDGPDRVGGGDEESVALGSAEAEVGDHRGGADLSEECAVGGVSVDAVTGAGPDVALAVDPEAVGDPGADLDEDLAAAEALAALHPEGADVMRAVGIVADAGVG